MLVMAARTASANSVTYTDAFGPLNDVFEQQLRVSLFNPSLGTLDRVIVAASGTVFTGGTITNSSTSPRGTTVTVTAAEFDAELAAGSPADLAPAFNIFAPGTEMASQGFVNIPPGSSQVFGPYSHSSGTLTELNTTNPGILAEFLGIGSFGYDFTASLSSLILSAGSFIIDINTNASGTLSVQYDYTPTLNPQTNGDPVPEPASLVLLGTGLLVVAWRARKSRSS